MVDVLDCKDFLDCSVNLSTSTEPRVVLLYVLLGISIFGIIGILLW